MFPTYGLFNSTDRVANLKRDRYRRIVAKPDQWRWLWRAYFVFVLLVASLPLFVYMLQRLGFFLIVMIALIAPLQIITIVRTVALAMEETLKERTTGGWEAVILTGISPRQIVRGKWWAIVQAMWPQWLFVAVARLGIAYGLAQYLYLVNMYDCPKQILRAACYYTDPIISYSNPANPAIYQLIAAFAIIAFITFFELHVIAAIGLLSALLPFKNRVAAWFFAFLLCGVVIGGGLITTIDPPSVYRSLLLSRRYECVALTRQAQDTGATWQEAVYKGDLCRGIFDDLQDIANVGQLSGFSLTDSGTLLSANIMRPTWTHPVTVIFQTILCATIAILFFRFLTWVLLWVAEKMTIMHGALPTTRAEFRRQSR